MATVQETIESGILPIVIETCDVNFFESREKLSRTHLTINSLDLGVLTYEQYRMVARRAKQANQLADRHVQKLFRILPTLMASREEVSCYIIPIYARLVRDGELVDILLRAMSIYPDAHPSRVCIEISSDILFEDIDSVRERIEQLRSMGYRIALSEVGDRFCPIFSLAELDFDYAFLDPALFARLTDESGERVVGSIVSYLKGLGVKSLATDVTDPSTLEALRRIGCDGFVANLPPEVEPEVEAETEIEAEAEIEPEIVQEPETQVEPEVEDEAESELNIEFAEAVAEYGGAVDE